ncbi:MAG: ATP phosphoribosyltransferase regulatory subunit [Gammaproteobacteria bacterium]|nr:ATP phosphoribosyltransferase regulatory subunit [Gammaproteobacteria bacterium]
MNSADRWILPAGIEELLPPEARRLEALQRTVSDLFAGWGYDLVIPPYLDYLESLLTGTSQDLDLQTLKVIDQPSGRLLGLRADMTPQVARIDARHMSSRSDAPVRLCYVGPVFRALPNRFVGSRTPQQAGAELYGHAGVESDAEILGLLVETVRAGGIDQVHLDIGHVGVFRALVAQANLSAPVEAQLFEALQRKAKSEIEDLVEGAMSPALADQFVALCELNGGVDVLAKARTQLSSANEQLGQALDELEAVHAALGRFELPCAVQFDLAELRGYRYHAGLVFAAFVPGYSQEVARGGRYDHIGEAFGRARPATGFSTDLRVLAALNRDSPQLAIPPAIFAPYDASPALRKCIGRLRKQGERVIEGLPGQHGGAAELKCDRELTFVGGNWVVSELNTGN